MNAFVLNAFVANAFVLDVERSGDARARERLLDVALPDRRTKTCERLRAGRLPAAGLALVARDRFGRVVGTVRLWHVAAGARPALMLGPLAVDPRWQGLGVGAALMREALARAAASGHRAVLLVGDAPYYARFGFSAALTASLDLPGPVERARFLALELIPGALDGARGPVVATGARAAQGVRHPGASEASSRDRLPGRVGRSRVSAAPCPGRRARPLVPANG